MTIGVSAKGESHVRVGRGNEDAWSASERANGAVIAVADGVGSVPHGSLGAVTAVRVGVSVGCRWLNRELAHDAVPREVTSGWLDGLGQEGPADCATTLLLAAVRYDGCVLLAWLGDGLVRAEVAGETWGSRTQDQDHEWGCTPALAAANVDERWQVATVPGFQSGDGVLLASDGVSEGLVPERIPRLLSAVRSAVERDGPDRVTAEFERDLEVWPTPGGRDDRTMALLLGASR